mgnify:CR=1 FL=1
MIEQNHEYYVSPEVAKLLKQAGFDWPCNHAICCDSTHYPNLKEGDVLEYNHLECSELMEGKKPHMLLCPTLEVAQRWLREVKNIVIYVCISNYSEWEYIIRKINKLNHKAILVLAVCWFYTYEKAQEAGIKKALELILEKGE